MNFVMSTKKIILIIAIISLFLYVIIFTTKNGEISGIENLLLIIPLVVAGYYLGIEYLLKSK
jgi:hypothetical protein